DLFYFDGSGLRVATNIPNWGHLFEFTNGRPGVRPTTLEVWRSYPVPQCGDACGLVLSQAGHVTWICHVYVSDVRIGHAAGKGRDCSGVFEGAFEGIETNDIGKTGMVFTNGPTGGGTTTQVTCSNCQLSRCDGWGAEQLGGSDQITWISPVFVCNG